MKDETGRKVRSYNTPRPKWPVCVDEDGNYIVLGSWRLIEYLGFFKKSPEHDGYHKYLADHIPCGLRYEMMQDSLVKSERLGLDKCRSKSCPGKDKDKDKDIKRRITNDGKQERMEKSFNEWVELMRSMRATPLEFRKGFDSERQAATIPIMCACGYKR